ncbi:hypothetical protein [Cyclobacterium xiamenense]|uniref:hypothetical protein n=1 Tax=Cyclobacterium xiamenense TaxID=1297121 RepID=UPI0035CEE409
MIKSNSLAVLVVCFLILCCTGCGDSRLSYAHFTGGFSELTPLESRHIVLLYTKGDYGKDTLASMLETYDRAFALAAAHMGREPAPAAFTTEKLPLAIVPLTCGPGCGRIGQKGMEITEEKFEGIYREFVSSGRHDHLFFYELGRNFWFFDSPSENPGLSDIRTGFAVFFRDLLLRELEIETAPINGNPYAAYMRKKHEKWQAFRAGAVKQDWEQMQEAVQRHFPHGPLFWSSLWEEAFLRREDLIQETLQEGNPHPMRDEASWWRFLNRGYEADE